MPPPPPFLSIWKNIVTKCHTCSFTILFFFCIEYHETNAHKSVFQNLGYKIPQHSLKSRFYFSSHPPTSYWKQKPVTIRVYKTVAEGFSPTIQHGRLVSDLVVFTAALQRRPSGLSGRCSRPCILELQVCKSLCNF